MSVQIPISGQIEEARAAAEAPRLAMARLVAVAGHDLKQPIQVAMLSIALAISEIVPATAAKRLKTALDAMKRLGTELDDIARLSQQGAALRPRPRAVDLDEVLAAVERDWRAYADACGTVLRISRSRVRVQTDPEMLKTILRNLVGNAIRHAGPRGRVLIACRRVGDMVSIDVQDNGDGIPIAYLSRIFDAFQRCGEAESEDRLGLGLTIVRQTAEMLRHPISVRSVENEGSTFSVELPLLGQCFSCAVDAEFVGARPN
jgi:signal transduction histidine kinase